MFKKMKYLLIALAVLFVLGTLLIYLVRLPSYTIQASGKLYVINKVSRDIQVFELLTGKLVDEIPIGIESHEALTANHGKAILVTNFGATDSKGNIIKVINTDTNLVEKTIEIKGANVNGMVNLKSPNKVVLVDYVTNNLSILNIENDSVEAQIATNQKKSHLAVIHPNKPMAYVTNMASNSVSVIDFDLNELIKIIPCGVTTESIDITPDGSEVWATNKAENSISTINTSTNEVETTLPTGDEPLKIKFSIDGDHCLIANAGAGTISVFETKSKKEIKTINIPGKKKLIEKVLFHTPRPVNILMHPNGQYAFVSNSNASKIEVIDMKTFAIVSNMETGKIPDAMAFVE